MVADVKPYPAVVEVVPAPELDGTSCHCLCGARHPEQPGVCEGWLGPDGVRVFFASLWAPAGVAVCGSCVEAYPYR